MPSIISSSSSPSSSSSQLQSSRSYIFILLSILSVDAPRFYAQFISIYRVWPESRKRRATYPPALCGSIDGWPGLSHSTVTAETVLNHRRILAIWMVVVVVVVAGCGSIHHQYISAGRMVVGAACWAATNSNVHTVAASRFLVSYVMRLMLRDVHRRTARCGHG